MSGKNRNRFESLLGVWTNPVYKTSWASLPAKQAVTVGFSSGFNVKLLHDWSNFDLPKLMPVEHIFLMPSSCLSLTLIHARIHANKLLITAQPIRNLWTPASAEMNKRGFLWQASLPLSPLPPPFFPIPYPFRRLLRRLFLAAKLPIRRSAADRTKSDEGLFWKSEARWEEMEESSVKRFFLWSVQETWQPSQVARESTRATVLPPERVGERDDEMWLSPRLFNGNSKQNKMAAGFSGALQLTDLDDFITPSQVNAYYTCTVEVVSGDSTQLCYFFNCRNALSLLK